jgi:GNAT superfamily N-acetyltransferase
MIELQADLRLKMVKFFTIQDGTTIAIGLAGPEDEQRLIKGFNKLSLQTKLYRFHYGKNKLSTSEKDYLLNIDNYNHLAIGAVDVDKDQDVGIGMIRYIRDKYEPWKAEVALTVIDEYQNKGIGTYLYNEIIEYACKNDIRLLINYVMKENAIVLKVLKQFGGKIKEDCGDHYLIEIVVSNKC